ncbi:MAG: hypothetical protein V3T59_01150 [Desulfobacterales bacterium]
MSPEIFIERNIYYQCLSYGVPRYVAKKYAAEGLSIYKKGYEGRVIDLIANQLSSAKKVSDK